MRNLVIPLFLNQGLTLDLNHLILIFDIIDIDMILVILYICIEDYLLLRSLGTISLSIFDIPI
jgi:hypothetical protein